MQTEKNNNTTSILTEELLGRCTGKKATTKRSHRIVCYKRHLGKDHKHRNRATCASVSDNGNVDPCSIYPLSYQGFQVYNIKSNIGTFEARAFIRSIVMVMMMVMAIAMTPKI